MKATYKNTVFLSFFIFVFTAQAREPLIIQGFEVCKDASIYSAPEARDKHYDVLTVSRANVSYRALIKFDITKTQKTHMARDAALMLFLHTEYHPDPLKIVAYRLTADWSANQVTWNHRKTDK